MIVYFNVVVTDVTEVREIFSNEESAIEDMDKAVKAQMSYLSDTEKEIIKDVDFSKDVSFHKDSIHIDYTYGEHFLYQNYMDVIDITLEVREVH